MGLRGAPRGLLSGDLSVLTEATEIYSLPVLEAKSLVKALARLAPLEGPREGLLHSLPSQWLLGSWHLLTVAASPPSASALSDTLHLHVSFSVSVEIPFFN